MLQGILKRVKISKSLFLDFLTCINRIDHSETENRGHETLGSSFWAPEPKNHKKGKISNSLFQDFMPVLNQIVRKESKNRSTETPGSILMAPGSKNLKKVQNNKIIFSRLYYRIKPNR